MRKTRYRQRSAGWRGPWSSLRRADRPWLNAFVSPRLLSASFPPHSQPSGIPPDWPSFWQQVQTELRKVHFQGSTLKVYRQVLRGFSRFARTPPARTTSRDVMDYLGHLVTGDHRPLPSDLRSPSSTLCPPTSAAWLSVNISVLRTSLDKLGGLSVTEGVRTPKRPRRLPEFLKPAQAACIIEAAPTLRDRLLLGLLYGCGLKVGETCGLRWSDVDLSTGRVRVSFAAATRQRWVEYPEALTPVLKAGVVACEPSQYIFAGAVSAKPLTTRMAERVLKKAVRAAGLPETITCMTLRHAYAIERLRAGVPVHELRERLGHESIETTLEYVRCIPKEVVSPAERLDIGPIELDQNEDATGMPIRPVELPGSVLALPIPLVPDTEPAPFVEQMRMRLADRFLCTRGVARQTGPPR